MLSIAQRRDVTRYTIFVHWLPKGNRRNLANKNFESVISFDILVFKKSSGSKVSQILVRITKSFFELLKSNKNFESFITWYLDEFWEIFELHYAISPKLFVRRNTFFDYLCCLSTAYQTFFEMYCGK